MVNQENKNNIPQELPKNKRIYLKIWFGIFIVGVLLLISLFFAQLDWLAWLFYMGAYLACWLLVGLISYLVSEFWHWKKVDRSLIKDNSFGSRTIESLIYIIIPVGYILLLYVQMRFSDGYFPWSAPSLIVLYAYISLWLYIYIESEQTE